MKSLLIHFLNKLPFVRGLQKRVQDQGRYPAGHYYSPIPLKEDVETMVNDKILYTPSEDEIDLQSDFQLNILCRYKEIYKSIPFTDKPSSCRYYYDQPWFCYFDAISLYCFLSDIKPKQIVEVGSGYSSAVILDAIENQYTDNPKIAFVEPFPERLNVILREKDRSIATIHNKKVQEVPIEIFESLEEGDLLFIDSSHVLKYGSDLHYLMFNILPRLKKGVFVHFHDIIWPFEYFDHWLLEGRYWNEIYVLRTFLAYNTKWKIHFFNSYVTEKFESELRKDMPLALKNPGGSLYIQKIC